MKKAKRARKCDWCKATARYQHLHVADEPEYACEQHHQGCDRCRPIGGDKYWNKTQRPTEP